jgi:MtfA peptidase
VRFGRRRREPFPEEWRSIVESRFLPWHTLDEDSQERLLGLTRELIERKSWEAARGFTLTTEMRVTIAVHAALLILELDHRYYRGVQAIIVHPTTVVLTGERPAFTSGLVTEDPLPVIGEAQPFGPVVIAWDAASNQARHPERGHNVIYHEFAHKLDMLDGSADGLPPMASAEEAERWREVLTGEYELLSGGKGGHLLDRYGGVNPGEFLAVATEVFFDRPVELRQDKPLLYDVLRAFYRQDPADRAQRAAI